MDNEIRLVHREETFNDLAVRELGRSRSACICRLQFGACLKEECVSCPIGQNYRACYSQMNDYDKQRLSTYVSENYRVDSLQPGKWMSYKGLKKHTFRWIVAIIFCLIILFLPLCLMMPGDKPKKIDDKFDGMIISVMNEVKSDFYDINRDNKINCIDYSLIFKIKWDKKYPDYQYRCEIVRNMSNTLHHLFIIITDDDYNKIEVEPWAENKYRYLMEENWDSKTYNPKYNIYGETKEWLSKVKVYE